MQFIAIVFNTIYRFPLLRHMNYLYTAKYTVYFLTCIITLNTNICEKDSNVIFPTMLECYLQLFVTSILFAHYQINLHHHWL